MQETAELGLRERKAAGTRIALARAMWKRLGESPLEAITVDELAAMAQVSRVTFFNYFPSKADALDYAMTLWEYEGQLHAANAGYTGRRALEHVFERTGEMVAESPERARRLIGYFALRNAVASLPVIGAAEHALIAPGKPRPAAGSSVHHGDYLMHHLELAIAAGEIAPRGGSYEYAHLLGALSFGSALVGHSHPKQDWRALYRHHVNVVLGDAPKRAKASKRGATPSKAKQPRIATASAQKQSVAPGKARARSKSR